MPRHRFVDFVNSLENFYFDYNKSLDFWQPLCGAEKLHLRPYKPDISAHITGFLNTMGIAGESVSAFTYPEGRVHASTDDRSLETERIAKIF